MKSLENYFDHTILKPEAQIEDVKKLCKEAKDNKFFAVCVNPYYVKLAVDELKGSDVQVASVIGFPLGSCESETKVFETQRAVKNGATEIDMVINIGALKDKNYLFVEHDIKQVVEACGSKAILKVILETCLLSQDEIVIACKLSEQAGAHFVKTSTGFLGDGASEENVKLMKDTVGDRLEVKASGGIRTLEIAEKMIKAGADRIGASASVAIMDELKNRGK